MKILQESYKRNGEEITLFLESNSIFFARSGSSVNRISDTK